MTPQSNPKAPADVGPKTPSPWWRHRMMWLVFGGPAIVVVAAIATGVIAARGADVVLHQDEVPDRASVPAEQGRNHAASPELPRR